MFDLFEAAAEQRGEVSQSVPDEMRSLFLNQDIHGLDCTDPVVCQPGRNHMQASQVPSMFMEDHVVGIIAARAVELVRSEQLLYSFRRRNSYGPITLGRIARHFLQKKVNVLFLEALRPTDGVDVFSLGIG